MRAAGLENFLVALPRVALDINRSRIGWVVALRRRLQVQRALHSVLLRRIALVRIATPALLDT